MKKNIETKIFIFVVILVAFAAIFLRTYKFGEYLHFKWDQARDLEAISEAYDDGFNKLPLLGPRAVKMDVDGEKEQLRLGAGYYYLQYFTAKIFNSQEPDKIAYFELFCSVLTILMLYYFCRTCFDKWFSLLAASLFAFSLMAIQFSRFAWNPNSLILFSLICFWALLRFYEEDSFKRKALLVLVWGISFAIAGQLHYVSFFLVAIISFLYVFYKNFFIFKKGISFFKKKVACNALLYLLIIIISFSAINTTMIMAEISYNGENTKNFFAAFSEKSEDSNLFGKIIKNTKVHGEDYLTIITGVYITKDDFPVNSFFVGSFIMALGFLFLTFLIKKEKKGRKKDFYVFLMIWFLVYFVFTIPIAYKHYIRYFLIVFPLPFIMISAFVYYFQKEKYNKWIRLLVWILPILILFINFYKINKWFDDLRIVQDNSSPYINTNNPIRNREKDDITLGQMNRAVEYMHKELNDSAFVTFSAPIDYKISYNYLFDLKDIIPVYVGQDDQTTYFSKTFFAISNKKKEKELIPDLFFEEGEIKERKVFGQVVVYRFVSNKEYNEEKIVNKLKQENSKSGVMSDHYKITIDDFLKGKYKEFK